MKSIATSVDKKSAYGFADAGNITGVNMSGMGMSMVK